MDEVDGHGWTDGWTWMDRVDGQMNGQVDEWMDR